MCFGSSDGGDPNYKPADYALDQSHTRVEKKTDGVTVKPVGTNEPKPLDTVVQQAGPGLSVGNM